MQLMGVCMCVSGKNENGHDHSHIVISSGQTYGYICSVKLYVTSRHAERENFSYEYVCLCVNSGSTHTITINNKL